MAAAAASTERWRHPSHAHFLMPADPSIAHAVHGGRWYCDIHQASGWCGSSPAGQMWRCVDGCDFDACDACLRSAAHLCSQHPHRVLEADPSVVHASVSAKWFCDACQGGWTGASPAGAMYRCLAGCDFDLCQTCMALAASDTSGAALESAPAAAQKTFAQSTFLRHYGSEAYVPRLHHQLEGAVYNLISALAHSAGVPSTEADQFFTELRTSALSTAMGEGGSAELLQPNQLMFIAVRLWTSALTLRGREFCALLNQAIRDDDDATIGHAAIIAHALNKFCVARRAHGAPPVPWPASHVTYRGTAMPRVHRSFFQVGKQYRAPMYVATSLREDVAIKSFLMRLPPPEASQQPPFQEPTLWRFHLDGTLPEGERCAHVNFIDRTDGTVNQEHEFLYAPYSAFVVRAVTWHASPLVNTYASQPHMIDVDVISDNRT
eukprot:CAMPEP_0117548876 /NCGR_PEP_ID=MMETSP0784-20121206/47874_1 /TAXON_ID=39447 /ORGANISM="" /LENGTH=434 /DNA_ID=CAMNT_0005345843 /DNA_START=46 /DNA_END=1346 /DNA_ORIENTATION=+